MMKHISPYLIEELFEVEPQNPYKWDLKTGGLEIPDPCKKHIQTSFLEGIMSKIVNWSLLWFHFPITSWLVVSTQLKNITVVKLEIFPK